MGYVLEFELNMQDPTVTPSRKYQQDRKFFNISSLSPVFSKFLFNTLDSSKLQNLQREEKSAVI